MLVKRFALVTSVALSACSASPPPEPPKASATAQDFFFYSCVQAYMTAQSITLFDGSVGYAVEHSDTSAEVLNQLYESAKLFATGIRAPDYSDEEHGLPAVLVLCGNEAKSERVANLIRNAARESD